LSPRLGDIVIIDNQEKGRAACDPCRWGKALLSAALQSRSQSNRTGLRKAQDLAGKAAERTVEVTWKRIGAYSPRSPRRNAQTTSSTQDTLQSKNNHALAHYDGMPAAAKQEARVTAKLSTKRRSIAASPSAGIIDGSANSHRCGLFGYPW
jgi:hypothetical protein